MDDSNRDVANGYHDAPQPNGRPSEAHATLQTDKPDALEIVLENLANSVSAAVSALEGPLSETWRSKLRHDSKLPDAKCSALAARAVDLLHKAQLLLEPPSMTLADHFLGTQ